MVSDRSILIQEKGPIEKAVNGRVLLLSLSSGLCFELDPIASEIWALLAEAKSVVELCLTLALKHRALPATVCRDVMPFLQQLLEHRLVRVVDT